MDMKENMRFKADNLSELYRMRDGVSTLISSWKSKYPNYDSKIVSNENNLTLLVELVKHGDTKNN